VDVHGQVVSAESISKLLDGEEAMRLEEERARVEEEARRVAEMERMLRERQEREKEREAAEAQASAEAAQRSVAVRAALAAAIGSLTDKTQTLGQVVGSGEADDIEVRETEAMNHNHWLPHNSPGPLRAPTIISCHSLEHRFLGSIRCADVPYRSGGPEGGGDNLAESSAGIRHACRNPSAPQTRLRRSRGFGHGSTMGIWVQDKHTCTGRIDSNG